jgi:hypothetical protein
MASRPTAVNRKFEITSRAELVLLAAELTDP